MATFVAAFFARFVARYGIGVVVIVGWLTLAGALVALLVATIVACVDFVLSVTFRNRPSWPVIRTQFASVTLAGTLGGVAAQGLAFACLASLANQMPAKPFDSWSKGVAVLKQESSKMHFIELSPAMFAAVSFAIARASANRQVTTAQSIVPTGCLLATAFGFTPVVLVYIWLVYFPPPPPARPSHENMIGLLPLAIPLWCAMGAMFGGTLGVIAAAAITLLDYGRRNRAFGNRLWMVTIPVIILIIEAATNGWIGKFLVWWNK